MIFLPWLLGLVQILGIINAIRAVMDARTPQGAIARGRRARADFPEAQRIRATNLHRRPFALRFAVRAARLASPVQ